MKKTIFLSLSLFTSITYGGQLISSTGTIYEETSRATRAVSFDSKDGGLTLENHCVAIMEGEVISGRWYMDGNNFIAKFSDKIIVFPNQKSPLVTAKGTECTGQG